MAGVLHIDLNAIPARALNVVVRERLGFYLNREQPLFSRDKFHRDYRGLARQIGYQYHEIMHFKSSENPTVQILHEWTERHYSTIGLLIKYLQTMGRHDVVGDLKTAFEEDAELYLRNIRDQRKPVQVPEVSSCRLNDAHLDDSNILCTYDANTRERTFFDAFACYAEENFNFVSKVARYLESEEVGLKLFIPHRDMLAGSPEYPTFLQLIEERCPRVLVFLSPDFVKQPVLEALVKFAGTPGSSKKYRTLIPIMCETCEKPLPLLLKNLRYIDFTNGEWENLEKRYILVSSLRSNFPYCSFSSPESNPAPSTTCPQTTIIDDSEAPQKMVEEAALPESAKNINCDRSEFWKQPEQNFVLNLNDYCDPTFTQSASSIATSGFFSQLSEENIEDN